MANTHKWTGYIRWIVLAFCLLGLSTAYMVNTSWSSYKTETSKSSSVRLAALASGLTNSEPLKLELAPGDSQVIEITISNFEETGAKSTISEVPLAYSLQALRLTDNLPVTGTFYEDASCQTPLKEVSGIFKAGDKQERTVFLKWEWPQSADWTLSYELDAWTLQLTCEQSDVQKEAS